MQGATRRAFVFMKIEPGMDEHVIQDLLKTEEVREVHAVTGEFDLVACVEVKRGMLTDSTGEIVALVRHRIRRIKGVKDTETIISQEVYTK